MLENCGGLSNPNNIFSWRKGLEERAADFLGDLMTIANNLHFKPTTPRPKAGDWEDSGKREFYCSYKGEEKLLFTVKAYMNGNMHLAFDNEFVHVLNSTHGRLRGWINSKEEAEKETSKHAAEYFDFSFKIGREQLMLK